MKRTERHHLKENELAHLTQAAREALAERRSQTITIAVVAAVVAALALGYGIWRGRTQGRAGVMLAEALAVEDARVGPPPAPGTPSTGLTFPTEREKREAMLAKLQAAADAYPATDEGVFARYRIGATYMALDKPAEAATAYQQVIDRSPSSLYGQMAKMGLAEAQARSGQYDSAIQTYSELSQQKDGPLPVDGVLMQLGRTYLQAGKTAEAQQTFTRLVDEFPDSPFSGDARRQLETLKKS
jgi:TolA-binding protein